MGKNPAFLFYPADWQRDLEEHPLEIEGAWIRICCKLSWEDTRGTATKNLTKWARILRVGERKCLSIIEYLLNQNIADVIIQNSSITITSRRMVRDEYIKNIRRNAGSKGGNPQLKNKAKNPDLDKQNLVKQNPTLSVSVSVSGSNKDKTLYGECVFLRKEEYEKLVNKFGQNLTDKAIDLLNNYIQSSGKKYKSHYHTLLLWPMQRAQEGQNGPETNRHIGRNDRSWVRAPGPELSGEAQRALDDVKRLERERAAAKQAALNQAGKDA